MEIELDKLDSYLNDHYLDIEDSTYLFFKWILDNRVYVVPFPSNRKLTLMFIKSYQEFDNSQTNTSVFIQYFNKMMK